MRQKTKKMILAFTLSSMVGISLFASVPDVRVQGDTEKRVWVEKVENKATDGTSISSKNGLEKTVDALLLSISHSKNIKKQSFDHKAFEEEVKILIDELRFM